MFLKECIKNNIFEILYRSIQNIRGKEILHESLGSKIHSYPSAVKHVDFVYAPYQDLGVAKQNRPTRYRSDPIFLTGRFRSGSTVLWNIFRQLENCTSYYEPLNERQWFDPSKRGEKLDYSHINVENNYWVEYEDLKDTLTPYYRENWVDSNLYMDAYSSDWNLQKYIEKLIEHASGRPVLQFNRVDFRLPWLCSTFPNAKFVHIYRHPREQWVSTLRDEHLQSSLFSSLHDFQNYDKFYLRHWVEDLQFWFPFLRDWSLHPYCHFYYLWRLSFLFGQQYCDVSIEFEELASDPANTLDKLFNNLNMNVHNIDNLLSLIRTPKRNKWELFATDEWFKSQELFCEIELHSFFGWSS